MLTTIAVLGIAFAIGAPTWVFVLCWIALGINCIQLGIKIKEAFDN